MYINMMQPNNCPGPLRWHTAKVSPDLIENIYRYEHECCQMYIYK